MLSPAPALVVVGAAAFVGQPLERAFVRHHQGTAAYHDQILGPKMILVHGFVEFDPAVAYQSYHFFLNLPATFLQPRASIDFRASS